ncbi:MAG: caspase family protein [Saprospiraceae bacterium]
MNTSKLIWRYAIIFLPLIPVSGWFGRVFNWQHTQHSDMFAPPLDTALLWSKEPPLNGPSQFNSVIETFGGRIVAAGYSSYLGNQQMVVAFFDPKGNMTREPLLLGEAGKDECNAIIQTFDGGYVLVGYTHKSIDPRRPQKSEDKNPCILKVSASGKQLLSDIPSPSNEDDELRDVLQLSDGSLVAVGYINKQAFVVKYDRFLQRIRLDTLKSLGIAKALAITSNGGGQIAVTGSKNAEKQGSVFVLTMDENLEQQALYQEIESEPLSGSDIVYDPRKKRYVVSCNTLSSKVSNFNEKVSLFYTSERTLQRLDDKPYPKVRMHKNQVNALLRLPSGNFLMAGLTTHAEINPYPLLIESENDKSNRELRTRRNPDYRERVHTVCLMNDGSIVLAGSRNNKDSDRAWVFKIRGEASKMPANPIDKIDLTADRLYDQTPADTLGELEGFERAYLRFSVTNIDSTKDYWGLRAIITMNKVPYGLLYYDTLILGSVTRGATRTCALPLQGNHDLEEDSTLELTMHIQDRQGKSFGSFSYTTITHPAPIPRLKISEIYQLSDSIVPREQQVEVKVTVKNIGKDTARNVRLSCTFPYLVEGGIFEKTRLFPTLMKDDSVVFVVLFKVKWLYQFNQVRLSCQAYEEQSEYSDDYAIFYVPTEDYLEMTDSTGQRYVPNGAWRKGRGGPRAADFKPEKPEVRWTFVKNEDGDRKIYKDKNMTETIYFSHLLLRAKVMNYEGALNCSAIKLTNRMKEIEPDTCLIFKDKRDAGTYFIILSIYLSQEYNEFRVAVQEAGITKPLEINYGLPDLHVFSIGIDANLTAAVRDAEEVAAVFKKMEKPRSLFWKVDTTILNSKEETTYEGLNDFTKSIWKDINKVEESKIIKPQDYILLYCSSHGQRSREGYFSLLVKVAEEDNMTTPYDFDEILNKIKKTNCQRIILVVDACQSGSIELKEKAGGYKANSFLYPILGDSTHQFALLTSSQANQMSCLTSDQTQSVFTKAFLDALANKNHVSSRDNFITLNEIQVFIDQRMPALLEGRAAQKPYFKYCKDDHTRIYCSQSN